MQDYGKHRGTLSFSTAAFLLASLEWDHEEDRGEIRKHKEDTDMKFARIEDRLAEEKIKNDSDMRKS